jgi:hypothetical protein
MSAKLQWATAHLNSETVLTCGHVVATLAPLSDEVYCEKCILPFEVRLDQELEAVAEARRQSS